MSVFICEKFSQIKREAFFKATYRLVVKDILGQLIANADEVQRVK